jgi:hypothetical protein
MVDDMPNQEQTSIITDTQYLFCSFLVARIYFPHQTRAGTSTVNMDFMIISDRISNRKHIGDSTL